MMGANRDSGLNEPANGYNKNASAEASKVTSAGSDDAAVLASKHKTELVNDYRVFTSNFFNNAVASKN